MRVLQEIDQVQYGICEPSDLHDMGTVLATAFSAMDPPAIAVGLTAQEFAAFVHCFASKVLVEQVTIVARSAGTDEMVGALLAEDAVSPMPSGMENLSEKFEPIFSILNEVGAEYWHNMVIHPKQCLHLFLLGVARGQQRRGIAQNLVRTCLQHGAQRGYRLAVTEATNGVSQHIFRKLGFTTRVERLYREYTFQGKTPFACIQDHPSLQLMDNRYLFSK